MSAITNFGQNTRLPSKLLGGNRACSVFSSKAVTRKYWQFVQWKWLGAEDKNPSLNFKVGSGDREERKEKKPPGLWRFRQYEERKCHSFDSAVDIKVNVNIYEWASCSLDTSAGTPWIYIHIQSTHKGFLWERVTTLCRLQFSKGAFHWRNMRSAGWDPGVWDLDKWLLQQCHGTLAAGSIKVWLWARLAFETPSGYRLGRLPSLALTNLSSFFLSFGAFLFQFALVSLKGMA